MVKVFILGFVPSHRQDPPHPRTRRTAGCSVTMTTMDDVVSDLPYYFTGFQFK